jgi:regulator of replication initiation timing
MATMTDRDAAEMIVKQTMDQIKPLTEGMNQLIEENRRLTAENSRLAKSEPPKQELATKEEIDAIFGLMDPTFRPSPKPEREKTELDKETERILNAVMGRL